MKTTLMVISAIVLMLLATCSPVQEAKIQQVDIALLNNDFEEGFRKYNNVGELLVANDWFPWYQEKNKSPGGVEYFRPEYKAEQVGVGAGRVYSGVYSQKMFTTFAPHNAGIYQQINTVKGTWYRFEIWVYIWSSGQDNPDKSVYPGRYRALVGANPWARTDAMDDTTIWGEEIVDQYNQWKKLSVTFQAWGNTTTLFTRGNPWYGAKHNDSYWDLAGAMVYELDNATPQPTYTVYPTYTPGATVTPYPTLKPLPTHTPYPTFTPGVNSTPCVIDDFIWIPVTKEPR